MSGLFQQPVAMWPGLEYTQPSPETGGRAMEAGDRIVITGGAGYIGSVLAGELLRLGYRVHVLDALLFGGDSLLAYFPHPSFSFEQVDLAAADAPPDLQEARAVFHLAALVGFPVCQQVGEDTAFRYNVTMTQRLFEAAERAGAERFLFASTYSNYGMSADGEAVTEESPTYPQSLYARTKIAAEDSLRERGARAACAPVIPRFATLFGVSPRTRFDLIVNQFVLEAVTKRKLVLYQGDFRRSFVHIRDVVEALVLLLEAPLPSVRNEIFNIGSPKGNLRKHEIADLVAREVPGTAVEQRDLSFGGDMRDVQVSSAKVERVLGFRARRTVEEGIREVHAAIASGLIKEPGHPRYRNHQFVLD
jgi:nucleoside-diphosphate-sugar epimerase